VGNDLAIDFEIREARPEDGAEMLALMPRLAEFDVPDRRDPEHLWRDDAKLLQRWIDGEEECLVQVAISGEQKVLGFALTRICPEPLSREPSAHLEAIAVDRAAEGQGVAKALLNATETAAGQQGAESMTLHVISTNKRARQFYEHSGYFGELIRYIKDLK